MRIRNGLVKALAFMIGSILVLASNGPRRMLAQRNQPSDGQQQTRPKREAQPKTDPATIPNKPIAQGDVDFERPLALPAIIGNLDENLPDTDDPRPGRTHQPRAPGGPGRGGNGGSDQPGGRTTPIVLPAATLFGKQIQMGNDPMVAVGENFVVATQAHAIYFYDKQSGRAITPPQPKLEFTSNRCGQTAETGGMCMEQFFAPFFAPFLNDSNGKPDRSRPNPQDINRHLDKVNLLVDPLHFLDPSSIDKLKKMVCDPDNPTASGCVNEGYDTRVLYDKEHRRFWVESNLRNPIYGSGDESSSHIVVPDWTHLHQRFTAVAVSRSEDPRDGFHEYVLSSRPGDWPTIGVHGSVLIIGAHGKKNVHLFDAAKLRSGNDAFDLVHLGSYSDSDFDSDAVWPVIQHDNRGGTPFIPTVPATQQGSDNVPTFLVGRVAETRSQSMLLTLQKNSSTNQA